MAPLARLAILMIMGPSAANHLRRRRAVSRSGVAMRFSAAFIATCMVVIAASLAGAAYLVLGFSGIEAAATAMTILAVLATANLFSGRGRGHEDAGPDRRIVDLSEGTAQLALQVRELGRRMIAVETALTDTAAAARAASVPLATEIDELGTLVHQLAQSVAAHEAALTGAASPAFAGSGSPSAERPGRSAMDLQRLASPPPAARRPSTTPLRGEASNGAVGAPAAANPELAAAPDRAVGGPFDGMAHNEIFALIRAALEHDRIDLYMQPIVTLPQRRVRYYEALMRLRTEAGEVIAPTEYLRYAESGGLMTVLDNRMLFRCAQVVRRLTAKNREVGLFCNVAAATLVDAAFFAQFADFLGANRAFASTLLFEFTQTSVRALGPIEQESLVQLASLGFRFSMDGVGDLTIEPRMLAEQGFRFVKVPAALLLDRAGAASSDIHPADLAKLLGRYGIDLIAEKIESEGTVVDLLDYDIRFGQGFLFSPPRPVRAEVFESAAEPRRVVPAQEQPIAAEAQPVEIAMGAPARRRDPAEPAAPASARTPSGLARLSRDLMRRA